MTARVAAIWRHPIKAHGRERLSEIVLEAGRTLAGDRAWAVLHEAGQARPGEWSACANFTRGAGTPSLMAIEARSLSDGRVALTHPERPEARLRPRQRGGGVHRLGDPADAGGPRRAGGPDPCGRRAGNDGRRPPVAGPLRCRLAPRGRGTAGPGPLDRAVAGEPYPRRTRALGGVRLGRPRESASATPSSPCASASVAASPPPPTRTTGVRDADTLGALDAIHGAREFAVYVEVVQGGRVAEGDEVRAVTDPDTLHPLPEHPRVVFLRPLATGREQCRGRPLRLLRRPGARDRVLRPQRPAPPRFHGRPTDHRRVCRRSPTGARHCHERREPRPSSGFSTFPFDIFPGWGEFDAGAIRRPSTRRHGDRSRRLDRIRGLDLAGRHRRRRAPSSRRVRSSAATSRPMPSSPATRPGRPPPLRRRHHASPACHLAGGTGRWRASARTFGAIRGSDIDALEAAA